MEQLNLFEDRPDANTIWAARFGLLLDTEGFIGICGNKDKPPNPNLEVGMTEDYFPKLLLEYYGGSVRLCLRPKHPKAKPLWRWAVHGRAVIRPLRDALPWIVLKDEQARIVLSVAERINPRRLPLSFEERSFRLQAYNRCRILNRRGLVLEADETSIGELRNAKT